MSVEAGKASKRGALISLNFLGITDFPVTLNYKCSQF